MWLDGQAHKNHLTSIYNLHSSFISLMTSILTEEHFCSYRLQMCPTTRISNHIKCRLSHPKASDAHLLIFAGHCCNQQYDQLRNAYTHPHPRSQRFLFWSTPYRMLSKGKIACACLFICLRGKIVIKFLLLLISFSSRK